MFRLFDTSLMQSISLLTNVDNCSHPEMCRVGYKPYIPYHIIPVSLHLQKLFTYNFGFFSVFLSVFQQ